MHAELARDVARRRHHPAPARMSDDQRHIPQVRVIPLFDRRIERIAIHMRNAQQLKFRVPDDARTIANRAGGGVRPGMQRATVATQQAIHDRTGSTLLARGSSSGPRRSVLDQVRLAPGVCHKIERDNQMRICFCFADQRERNPVARA
jgi:hypothetical protein